MTSLSEFPEEFDSASRRKLWIQQRLNHRNGLNGTVFGGGRSLASPA